MLLGVSGEAGASLGCGEMEKPKAFKAVMLWLLEEASREPSEDLAYSLDDVEPSELVSWGKLGST